MHFICIISDQLTLHRDVFSTKFSKLFHWLQNILQFPTHKYRMPCSLDSVEIKEQCVLEHLE